MSYGNLLSFIPDPEPSQRSPESRQAPSQGDTPKRETEKSGSLEMPKTPADYAAETYSIVFGGAKEMADKGVKVKLELPCPDCVMEFARVMAGG